MDVTPCRRGWWSFGAVLLVGIGFARAAVAQGVAPGSTPTTADTPSIRVGAVIFANYIYQTEPQVIDAGGNLVNHNAFDISRAYINVTGNLSHIVAFRVTPDVTRDTSPGSSLNGSLTLRLKYAYVQTNFDDWMTKGSWVRFGIQQTPYLDYTEGIYRYRFQGTMFPERVGLFSSADAGVSGHWNFPGNYGDVHAGFYNGENYNKAEVNNEKGFMIRGTERPFPLGGPELKGLRITGFVIE